MNPTPLHLFLAIVADLWLPVLIAVAVVWLAFGV